MNKQSVRKVNDKVKNTNQTNQAPESRPQIGKEIENNFHEEFITEVELVFIVAFSHLVSTLINAEGIVGALFIIMKMSLVYRVSIEPMLAKIGNYLTLFLPNLIQTLINLIRIFWR